MQVLGIRPTHQVGNIPTNHPIGWGKSPACPTNQPDFGGRAKLAASPLTILANWWLIDRHAVTAEEVRRRARHELQETVLAEKQRRLSRRKGGPRRDGDVRKLANRSQQAAKEISQLNQAAQHTASASEQLAAAAEKMTAQAVQLRQLIGFFGSSERRHTP